MATMRERFAAVRDNARSRIAQGAPTSSGPRPATSGAPPASRAQGEIFDALSTTLPPAPVARNNAAPCPPLSASEVASSASSSSAPLPLSAASAPPSASATSAGSSPSSGGSAESQSDTVARVYDRSARPKGRKARPDDDSDAQAAPARKLPLSKGMLIVAGVALLLALFAITMIVKRGLLTNLKQRAAAKRKASRGSHKGGGEDDDGDAEDDGQADDANDGKDKISGAKGGIGGMLGGLFGARGKTAPVADAVPNNNNNNRGAATGQDGGRRAHADNNYVGSSSSSSSAARGRASSVPVMDPYQAGAGGRGVDVRQSPRAAASAHGIIDPGVRAPVAHVAAGPHVAPPVLPQHPQPQPQAYAQTHQPHAVHLAQQQQQQPGRTAPTPSMQPQRQASPVPSSAYAHHQQQHPPYAPHVQARLDGVPHPNMPPSTPQGRSSPGGGSARP